MPRPSLEEIFGTKPKQEPRNTIIDSYVRGAGQSASLGFGDEIMAGLQLPMLYGASRIMDVPGYSDKSFTDVYKHARDKERQQIKEAFDDNPKSYIAGGITGAVANPAGFSGNLVTQATKYGLAQAAGDSEADNLKDFIKDVVQGGAEALATGLLLKGGGKLVNSTIKGTRNAVRGAMARKPDALAEVSEKMGDAASGAFKRMRQAGATFNRPRIVDITNKVEDLLKQDTRLNSRLHGDTMGVLDDFKQAARSGDFDLEELHQFRRLFNGVVSKNRVSNPDDARLAKMAIQEIDRQATKLKPIDIRGGNVGAVKDLQQGIKGWAKLRKFDTVADIVDKSQGDINYVKRELSKIANNPAKYGFGKSDAAMLKEVARNSTGENLLKVLGKAGFDPSRLGSGVGAFFGSTAGGVLGGTTGAAAVPIVGTTARYGQKLVGRGKTERLLNAIETGKYNPATGIKVNAQTQGAIGRAAGSYSQPEAPAQASPQNRPSLQDIFGEPETPAKPVILERAPLNIEPQASFFDKVKQAESSGNPNAKAETSSASGLYQFTDQTWKDSVKKWGKKHGISVDMKNDPQAQELMVRELARDNARILTKQLKTEPTKADMYVAHFMGAPQAVKLIKNKNSKMIAAKVFPAEAKANKPIFYKDGKPRTIAEVYNVLARKVS